MYLTSEIKTALRKKRGVLDLTKGEAANQLGPTRNEKVRQSTYERITEWLAKDY